MRVTLIPKSTLRMTIGKEELQLSLPEGSSTFDACCFLAKEFGNETRDFLFDKKSGDCHVLFFVNKRQVRKDHVLEQHDRLTILPPLAGG